MLAGVQAQPDTRGIALDEVGITGLRYPLLVRDAQGTKRETVATVTMSVTAADDVTGAHLSRPVGVLHTWRDQRGNDGSIHDHAAFAQPPWTATAAPPEEAESNHG